jgi:predicted  nucleic acid-binding Zn-ribbon protein
MIFHYANPTKINNNLDKLQEDLMKELTEAEKQITDETRDLMVSLDEKQKELSEHQNNIINIKKYASDLFVHKAESVSIVTGQYHSTIWQKRASSDPTPLDVYRLFQFQLYIVN